MWLTLHCLSCRLNVARRGRIQFKTSPHHLQPPRAVFPPACTAPSIPAWLAVLASGGGSAGVVGVSFLIVKVIFNFIFQRLTRGIHRRFNAGAIVAVVNVCEHPTGPLVRNALPFRCGDVPGNAGNGEEVGKGHLIFDF